MNKASIRFLFSVLFFIPAGAFSQSDSMVVKDIAWDKTAPAGMTELFIPSAGSLLAGFIYRANGTQKHPTLLLLHGYPGNERNLDIAQAVRSHGWNVIYFDYRGSWGSQGKFSFTGCVEDVVNTVSFCKRYADSLKIDTSNIVLFGHSLGGWVCLKALQQLPGIQKGFAVSAWNIGEDFKKVLTEKEMLQLVNDPNAGLRYFVLNVSLKELFSPVLQDRSYYNLMNDGKALAGKQLILLDEHERNKPLAALLKAGNKNYFDYEVWPTDHPFTNKRISLINKVIAFLDK